MWVLTKERYREIFYRLNDIMFERLYVYMDIFKSNDMYAHIEQRAKQLEAEFLDKRRECTVGFMKQVIEQVKRNILTNKQWIDIFLTESFDVFVPCIKTNETEDWELKYGYTIKLDQELMKSLLEVEFPLIPEISIEEGFGDSYVFKFKKKRYDCFTTLRMGGIKY